MFNYYALFNLVWVTPVFIRIKHFFKIFWAINFLFIACLSVVYFRYFISNYKKTENSIKLIVWLMLDYILYIMLYRTSWMVFPGASSYLPLWIVNDSLKLVVLFIFAYALAKKTNKEFTDLQDLKNSLEQKVKEKTLEFRLAKEKIEEINEQRTNYFINLAHETKTPLTLITNYLDRYIKIRGSSRELNIIKENFNKLKDDMIRFLDIHKYEKGLVAYKHDNFINISDLIGKKIPLLNEYAYLKKMTLSFEVEDNIFLKSDPVAIDRIINNLFENSMKYSEVGSEIKIILKKEDLNTLLMINDTGMGMDKEQLEHIFQPYYQISRLKLIDQGIGMGLFIVKSIVESLQGTIDIESEVNKGTKISICLPTKDRNFKEDKTNEYKETVFLKKDMNNSSGINFSTEEKNILIVEDNKDMCKYLAEELGGLYNVFTAENGEEALNQLKINSDIDLILSDVMMDILDGYAFYEEVSRHEKNSNILFIFLTARSHDYEKIEMLAKGISDYLYKPFSIDELKAKILSVLKNANQQKMAGLKDALKSSS